MVRKDLGDSVEWIDVSTELNKHKTEKIYYKTDHHWTTLGAFYAFQAAAPSLGIEGDLSGKYVSMQFQTALTECWRQKRSEPWREGTD